MADVKDKRTPRPKSRRQSAQSVGSDMVNGNAVGSSLPFVAEKEDGYHNLLRSAVPYQGLDNPSPDGTFGGLAPPLPHMQLGGGGIRPSLPTLRPSTPITPVTGSGGTALPVTPPTVQTGSSAALTPDTGVPMPGSTPSSPPPAIPLPPTPPPPGPTVPMTPTAPPAATVSVASPLPPVANAGPNQTVTGSTATLNGTGSSDPQESQLTYAWSMLSGPSSIAIANPNAATTGISGLVAGSYVFQLTVTNSMGLQNTSTTSVTVAPANNSGATVNTGVTELNSGSTVLTTAPLGGPATGPYGGMGAGAGGGGGGGTADNNGNGTAPAETGWQKIMDFARDNWLWLALAAVGVGYIVFGGESKK